MTEDVDYRRTSRRPQFAELPEHVRTEVERLAGAGVGHAHPAVTSGFTGAYAGLLELRDGRRVFAKAADPDHPFAHAALPREASVLGRLEGRAGAPKLLGAGPAGVWNVNVLEAIDGHLPGMPWTAPDAAVAHVACVEWAALPADLVAQLTDATVAQDVGGNKAALGCLDGLAAGSRGWPEGSVRVSSAQAHELAELGHAAATWLVGDSLVHGDLRPDNMLVTPEGRARFVDWNWVARGPGWCDFVGLLPLMAHQGLDADAMVAGSPLLTGVEADAVDSFLAIIVGYMVDSCSKPAFPSSLTTVRAHQAQMARTFLAWLAHRRGW